MYFTLEPINVVLEVDEWVLLMEVKCELVSQESNIPGRWGKVSAEIVVIGVFCAVDLVFGKNYSVREMNVIIQVIEVYICESIFILVLMYAVRCLRGPLVFPDGDFLCGISVILFPIR